MYYTFTLEDTLGKSFADIAREAEYAVIRRSEAESFIDIQIVSIILNVKDYYAVTRRYTVTCLGLVDDPNADPNGQKPVEITIKRITHA